MAEVHFRLAPGHYACGVGARWGSQVISSTAHKAAVTCEGCKRTVWFDQAVQRYPVLERRYG